MARGIRCEYNEGVASDDRGNALFVSASSLTSRAVLSGCWARGLGRLSRAECACYFLMPVSRLFWKLFLCLAGVTLLATAVVGFYLANWQHERLIEQVDQ